MLINWKMHQMHQVKINYLRFYSLKIACSYSETLLNFLSFNHQTSPAALSNFSSHFRLSISSSQYTSCRCMYSTINSTNQRDWKWRYSSYWIFTRCSRLQLCSDNNEKWQLYTSENHWIGYDIFNVRLKDYRHLNEILCYICRSCNAIVCYDRYWQ